MELILLIADIVAALVVIYCIWKGFKTKRDWVIYAIACAVYVILGLFKAMPGLVALNIVATVLATRHALKNNGRVA